MPKEHHVIYIPGLKDQKKSYEMLINRWASFGIVPHVHRMGWHDGESFRPKLKRLVSEVNGFLENGAAVSLVGSSAGGSAALNTLLEQPQISGVVNLSGRLRAGENVYPTLGWAGRNSASFRESVLLFESREPEIPEELREKVLVITPIWDQLVPKSTAQLRGAHNQILPSAEHMLSGLLGITIFSQRIINFLKQKAEE